MSAASPDATAANHHHNSTMIATETYDDRKDEDDRWNNWASTARKMLAEFLGDLFLVFIGSLSFTIDGVGPIGAAFTHGFTIALLVVSFGHISGAHFNPAVTLGVWISGNISAVMAGFYILAQMLGAIVGAFLLRAVVTEAAYCLIAGGTTNLTLEDSGIGNAILLEIILTCLLVQTVLNAAVESDGSNVFAPLAIGLTVLVDILAGGDKSGASMNCARSFGPAVAYTALYPSNCTAKYGELAHCTKERPCEDVKPSVVWKYHYVDWVGPLVGAVIAGLLYRMFLTKKARRRVQCR